MSAPSDTIKTPMYNSEAKVVGYMGVPMDIFIQLNTVAKWMMDNNVTDLGALSLRFQPKHETK